MTSKNVGHCQGDRKGRPLQRTQGGSSPTDLCRGRPLRSPWEPLDETSPVIVNLTPMGPGKPGPYSKHQRLKRHPDFGSRCLANRHFAIFDQELHILVLILRIFTLLGEHQQLSPWRQALLMEIENQTFFIFYHLRDTKNRRFCTNRDGGKSDGMVVFEIVTRIWNGAWNRITMRTGSWIMQAGNDALLYSARNKMLQATGFFVHLVPLHPQHIDQEALSQAMTAQYCFCRLIASFGQRHMALIIHFNIAITCQTFEHLGHSWRCDAEFFCQARTDHYFVFHAHIIDCF